MEKKIIKFGHKGLGNRFAKTENWRGITKK